MSFWFRDRYKLPPNDPRFLDLTEEEILLEYETVIAAEAITKGGETIDNDDTDKSFKEYQEFMLRKSEQDELFGETFELPPQRPRISNEE